MHKMRHMLHRFSASERKCFLFCISFFLYRQVTNYRIKADTKFFTNHLIIKTEWAVLLINGFVLVLFLNILLNGLTIGIELLETLWRERNAKILRRVLEVVKD